MSFEHRNRRGDVYLLQARFSASGKPKYYFGRKLTGEVVEQVPEGYEVFEAPENAQVYLRRTRSSPIAEFERQVVADGIRRLSKLEHFIVTIENDCLVVYLPAIESQQVDDLIGVLLPGGLRSPRLQTARDHLFTSAHYDKMLRFRLVDEQERKYTIERWCFLGSIDNWMMLSAPPMHLADLVEDVAGHLGTEEFFELL